MEFKFTSYSDGVHSFTLSENASNLKLDGRFESDVYIDIKMDKSSHQIILNCELYTDANFECDRCGAIYSTELNKEFQLVYLFNEREDQLNNPNVKVLHPEEYKIKLDQEALEFSMLAVPMKKLCSEDCKGLCSHCGTNLNKSECNCEEDISNPVWDELLKLKNKSN